MPEVAVSTSALQSYGVGDVPVYSDDIQRAIELSLAYPKAADDDAVLLALALEQSLAELKPTSKSAADDNHDTYDYRDQSPR